MLVSNIYQNFQFDKEKKDLYKCNTFYWIYRYILLFKTNYEYWILQILNSFWKNQVSLNVKGYCINILL